MGLSKSCRPPLREGGAFSPSLCESVPAGLSFPELATQGPGMYGRDVCGMSKWRKLNYGHFGVPGVSQADKPGYAFTMDFLLKKIRKLRTEKQALSSLTSAKLLDLPCSAPSHPAPTRTNVL